MKKTVATVSVLRRGEKQWLFSLSMRLNEDDRDLPSNCFRDIGRALNTFVLHADLDDSNVFEENNLILGPYIYHENEEAIGVVPFAVKNGDSATAAEKIRSGLNAAAAIIRQGDGRIVRRRIKPIKQLLLPVDEA
jgi:hypothetical protein